jgi:hypothetical protein
MRYSSCISQPIQRNSKSNCPHFVRKGAIPKSFSYFFTYLLKMVLRFLFSSVSDFILPSTLFFPDPTPLILTHTLSRFYVKLLTLDIGCSVSTCLLALLLFLPCFNSLTIEYTIGLPYFLIRISIITT